MLYYQNGHENADLSAADLRAGLHAALDKLGRRKKVLAVPPDITRFYSRAGELTEMPVQAQSSLAKMSILKKQQSRMEI